MSQDETKRDLSPSPDEPLSCADETPVAPDQGVIVRFEGVSFAYAGAAAPALRDVSFEVPRGQATALMGPNGSGKSTALRLLLGLDHPSAGTVRVDGQVVDAALLRDPAAAKRLRQRVGLVFQDPETQLFCPSVEQEIAFGPQQMGLPADEVARRTEDCLALFGLTELRGRAPWRLSGGEKRRCALACVVSLGPELLCLDEPTNGLDEGSYGQLVSFLRAFVASGKTVLVATHDRAFAQALGARELRL